MSNEVLVKSGQQIVFRDDADFSPTAANDLRDGSATYTYVDLDFDNGGSGIADGAAYGSAVVDTGATRASRFSVDAAFEFTTAPTNGDVLELYWAGTHAVSGTNGQPGNTSLAEGAYTGYTTGGLAAGVKQLQYIGSFVCSNDGSLVQVGHVGVFEPYSRRGQLIVKNECGQTLYVTDAAEMHVVFTPLIDEVQ